jgi:hypothetical protein|tara:strand:- start:298 stop:432 length:135 start_codon:yes stop_codon:yes gene_type:complete
MIAVMDNASNTITIDTSLETQLIKTSVDPSRFRNPSLSLDARDA